MTPAEAAEAIKGLAVWFHHWDAGNHPRDTPAKTALGYVPIAVEAFVAAFPGVGLAEVAQELDGWEAPAFDPYWLGNHMTGTGNPLKLRQAP